MRNVETALRTAVAGQAAEVVGAFGAEDVLGDCSACAIVGDGGCARRVVGFVRHLISPSGLGEFSRFLGDGGITDDR